jgi:hypothetical protein
MAAANTGRPHRKDRIPPGVAALAAAELRDRLAAAGPVVESATTSTDSTVIDLSVYERAAQLRSYPEVTTTGNTNTSLTVPATAEAASRYQRLRGHLAALKQHAAAEALPTVMDQTATEQLSLTAALERLLAIEVDATEARRLAGRLRSASLPPLPPWPVSTLMPPPVWTASSSTSSPPGAIWSRPPTFCWWDRRGREDPPGGRAGPRRGARRLPHLLHHRRRFGRPLPPRRDRGPLGHHHAVLRRTDPAGH